MKKDIRKMAIIGQFGTTIATQKAIEKAKEENIRVIIAHPSEEEQSIRRIHRKGQSEPVITYVDNSVMVNGVRYVPVEKETNRMSRKTAAFLGMTAGMGIDINGIIDSHFRQLPKGIDIVKEYGLIQLKKSHLSRWERDAVVGTFERNYKKVE